MRRLTIAMAAGIAALVFQSAGYAAVDAKAAEAAAKANGCLNCHEVDKKKVGPSYKDASAKLKGKKVEDVATAMRASPVHKSAMSKVSDKDLKTILEWVLSL